MTYEQRLARAQKAKAGDRWRRLRDKAVVTLTVSHCDNPLAWFKRDGAKRQSTPLDWFTFARKFEPVKD